MSYDPNAYAAIQAAAAANGVPLSFALAIAQVESGVNPQRIGDGGHSVGLYQLNDAGEGYGLSVAQRQDPATNAGIALAQVGRTLQAEPGASLGQVAADAQRPADRAGYAALVTAALSAIAGADPAAAQGVPVSAPTGTGHAAADTLTKDGHAITTGVGATWGNFWNGFKRFAVGLAVAAVFVYALLYKADGS